MVEFVTLSVGLLDAQATTGRNRRAGYGRSRYLGRQSCHPSVRLKGPRSELDQSAGERRTNSL